VVASHYHADHIYGLQAFKDHTDAVIVAQERAGEYKENEETADERANQRLDQRRGASEASEPGIQNGCMVLDSGSAPSKSAVADLDNDIAELG
jgi:glyoxylase-like metal-dependent hydrolase (beta-lactamase superfamily II)